MPLSGEEIRSRLSVFAARWSVYDGSERGEAQTFLNELFECYGTHRQDVARFEHQQAGRFLDLIWPRVCVIEMKAPKEAKHLAKHRAQAFDYWRESADPDKGIPAPRYVVICAFRRLEIWEPGGYPNAPRAVLDLIDLPDQYDTLLFLAGRDAVFAGGQATLTREAVVHITDLYEQLKERRAADPDVLRDFVLQSVWCLFAEDLGCHRMCIEHGQTSNQGASRIACGTSRRQRSRRSHFHWTITARFQVALRLDARRSEICIEQGIGLTKLYNQVEDGAWTDLRDLHCELDEAVAVAYGWPTSVAHDSDETNRRLLELNREIAAGERSYSPFE